MNFNKLKSLMYVAELGSVNAAAAAVHLTQAAVSQHLKDLERELDLHLVDHSRRPIGLTKEGEELVDVTRQILRHWNQYLERKQTTEFGGVLVLGHVRSAITDSVARSLSLLRVKHPGLTIKLIVSSGVTRRLAQDVLNHKIDASFGVGPFAVPEELLWRPYCLERFYVIAPKKMHGRTDEEMLTSGAYLRHKPPALDDTIIDRELRRRGIDIDPIMEFDSYETVLLMVEHGVGVGIVPEPYLSRQKMQNLYCVPFGAPPLTREMGLMVRRDSPNMFLVDILWHAITDYAAEASSAPAGARPRDASRPKPAPRRASI